MDLKTHVREESEDDMVNVNSQVGSSMDQPFGEYTLWVFGTIGGESRAVAAALFPLELSWITSSPFLSACFTRLGSRRCVTDMEVVKKAMGAEPDGDDGSEGLEMLEQSEGCADSFLSDSMFVSLC